MNEEVKTNTERTATKPKKTVAVRRDTSASQAQINEIWDEIGEINKAINRVFDRLGLE
tara:strand:+ start:397 stop:570 length:174 start_codon:yes stop_codon:yes gene_type:complete